MAQAKEILDNLGMDPDEVIESASKVEAYKQLREREVELPSSVDVDDNTTIHRFQMIKEEIDLPMESGETYWVITDFDPIFETITLKVPGPWSKDQITFEQFNEGNYEPLYYEHEDGHGNYVAEPLFGY